MLWASRYNKNNKMTNKISIVILSILVLLGCKEKENRAEFFPKIQTRPNEIPKKDNVWVFIRAGQSNMAGRGKVEPNDTIPESRILTLNKNGELIIAKEPLHFYEPKHSGLDCGLSFGKELIKYIPDSISILIVPTAVGGSSISQWINNETFRNVNLFTNFKEKSNIGKKYGIVKGILWHQGERDAREEKNIEKYDKQLKRLFKQLREEIGNDKLPIIVGQLGSFLKTIYKGEEINSKIEKYIKLDSNAYLINTYDLNHRGDSLHFDSEGQRKIGERFANKFIEIR